MGCSKSKNFKSKSNSVQENGMSMKEGTHPSAIQSELEDENAFSELKKTIPMICIQENYDFSKKIAGQGSFGTVRVVYPKNNPSLTFALKSIRKEKVKKTIQILIREVEIMKKIDHPNIIKLFRVYQDKFYFHLLLEYCSGGELLERIIQNPRFSESYAIEVIKSMIYAIKYLHEMGVCHRDIKPENFVFKDTTSKSELKLIDFGLAYNFQNDAIPSMKTIAGSAYYIAPEVHSGKYEYTCDMWSLGVISFLLLIGDLPVKGANAMEIISSLEAFEAKKVLLPVEYLSAEAKLYLIHCLEKDPKKRLTSKAALHHKWFKTQISKRVSVDIPCKYTVLQKINNFRSTQKFKREAMKIILSMVRRDEIQHLKELFLEFDHDKTGKINIENVEFALKQMGMDTTSDEIDHLMENLRLTKENEIHYTDFISAILDSELLTKERIWAAFKFFDVDNTDFISIDNINDAMKRAGREFTEEEINHMLEECDILEDGKISFDEFFHILTSTELVKMTSAEFKRKNSMEFGSTTSLPRNSSNNKAQ